MARRTIIVRRRIGHLVLLGAVLLVIPAIVIVQTRLGRVLPVGVNALAAAGVLGILGVMTIREIRAGKRLGVLIRSDWQRCLYCFFDLRGLSHTGECPECGQRYEMERVRRTWRQAMRPEARGAGERMAEAD